MINRPQILNHLAQVNDPGLTGISIRTFLENAKQKTDDEVIEVIQTLKERIKTNRPALKRILGSQYEFFNRLKINHGADSLHPA